ncbi:family 16 glycoside hydrolase [Antarcticibacterium sp. 1MA-6-2]|uniref:family 16 glycoside hydrolase n=1 Tax=Antarcticibacterium sp. 1MA-6-2 TaxID=2908210 RepID=UPI002101DD28|nr:family 16 glycoside hydrolase [Antarcticibacterium sp. 1MA-6-2]
MNYRSEAVETIPFALKGYQADIDGKNNYTGQSYEERGRTTLGYRGEKVIINPPGDRSGTLRDNVVNNAWTERSVVESLGETDSLATLIKKEGWNEIHLVVNQNRMQHFINGILMSDVTDNDTVHKKDSGKLGIQVHVGPPMKVEYRNIRLKEL